VKALLSLQALKEVNICRVLNATLATRNTADFTGIGVNLIDPWKAGGIAPPGGQHPD
jgi:hypothetical protein